VSRAECGCGEELQTEGRVSWDCELNKDRRAAVMDVLSEKSKTNIPETSYRARKARKENVCLRRLLLDE
jgi:hypothetical protein